MCKRVTADHQCAEAGATPAQRGPPGGRGEERVGAPQPPRVWCFGGVSASSPGPQPRVVGPGRGNTPPGAGGLGA